MLKSITKMTAVAALLCAGENAGAQCPFTATVTPNNLILWPSTQDTLWTQVYDSYQWYKAGQPIAGATNQYLVVDHFMDAGSEFSVEVTANSCTEMSDTVLVDGWAFLPPVVMHEGAFHTDPLTG